MALAFEPVPLAILLVQIWRFSPDGSPAMNKQSEDDQVGVEAGVVFGDAAHVQQPALPLLVPDEEFSDSFVQMRRSRLEQTLHLLEEMEQTDFDWQNFAIALISFSVGLLFTAWLASIEFSTWKGFLVYVVGSCGATSGLVLLWTHRNFRKKNARDICQKIKQNLPNLKNLRGAE